MVAGAVALVVSGFWNVILAGLRLDQVFCHDSAVIRKVARKHGIQVEYDGSPCWAIDAATLAEQLGSSEDVIESTMRRMLRSSNMVTDYDESRGLVLYYFRRGVQH